MNQKSNQSTQWRREFLKGAASAAIAGLGSAIPAHAQSKPKPKVLRVMQWNHFVPAFDDWFNSTFIKEWGARNDTEVIVTNVGMTAIAARAMAEIKK